MTSCVIYRLFHHQVNYCHPPGKFVFGRICCKSCDTSGPAKYRISTDSPFTSRYHARLEYSSNGKWTLEDIGSCNGTYCNHRLLQKQEKVALRNGDLISLGVHPEDVDLKDDEDLSHRKYIFYKFYEDSGYNIAGSIWESWDTSLKDQLLSANNLYPFCSVWERQNVISSWPAKIPLSHKSEATESDIQERIDLLHLHDRPLFEQTIPPHLVRWIPSPEPGQPLSPCSTVQIGSNEQNASTCQDEHSNVNDNSNIVDTGSNSLSNLPEKTSQPGMTRQCTIRLTETFQLDVLGQLQFEPTLAMQLHPKNPASMMSHAQITAVKRRLRFKLRT